MRLDGKPEVMTAQHWAKVEIQLELDIEDDVVDVARLAESLSEHAYHWIKAEGI